MKRCIEKSLAKRIKPQPSRKPPNANALRTAHCSNSAQPTFPFAKPGDLWNFGRLFSPKGTMAYAIIRTGGRQYRVAEGDTVDVDLLDVDPGKTATLSDVLMFADGKNVTHGTRLSAEQK